MKLASFPVVRSVVASFGFACLAVACIAQSGDDIGTSSQALSVGYYYTCASTGACAAASSSGEEACPAGCTWVTEDGGPGICFQSAPCATGALDSAEDCTVNPACKATEHRVINGGGGGGGCTTWCGTKCC
jgi:hypothetical protein